MVKLEGLIDPTAATAPLGGGKEPICASDFAAIPQRFVLALPAEHTPATVTDGLGKRTVFQHAPDMQIFQDNDAMLGSQSLRQFVAEIGTLVGDFLLKAGDFHT